MILKIDKDVPLSRRHRSWKYDWDAMEPGDSFLATDITNENARSTAWAAAKTRPGWRFATRKEPGGTRIYRIK